MQLAVGDRIGAYRIVGHFVGHTYRGVHAGSPGRRVLIELVPRTSWREGSVQMLRAQRLVDSLQHPGIARILEIGMLADRTPWMAVEVPGGGSLYELLATRRLPPSETAALIRDIADVLAHAHARGVVHGALSVRSIMFRTPAQPGLVVADWGLCVEELTVFCAPELSTGLAFDGRADVYSLGVMAFCAATQMFPGDCGVFDVPGVPTALATLIARMLAVDPNERPTAAEVHAVAHELLADDEVDTQPIVRVEAVPEPASAFESGPHGEDIVYPGAPRIGRPRWTPSPDLPITSERAPTASGEIRKKRD